MKVIIGISINGPLMEFLLMEWLSKLPSFRWEDQALRKKPHAVELIKPISEMVDYLSRYTDLKDGYHLADVLMCFCFVSGDKNLHKIFQQRTKQITENKYSKEMLSMQLIDGIETFNVISRLSRTSSNKAVDVKRAVLCIAA